MKTKLVLSTVFAAAVASVVLVMPGVAAAPSNSVNCNSTTTTITWTGGLSSVQWSWTDDQTQEILAAGGEITKGPGSVADSSPSGTTTVTVQVRYYPKHGSMFELSCQY
jgi:hypothetical protein